MFWLYTFPAIFFGAQIFMFLLSGCCNKAYTVSLFAIFNASELEFLFIWYSHCYSSFLLLTFPYYIFAHPFTINFIFTTLPVYFLSKAYSKLITHHCFFQPSFPLKIFVLISSTFGRSSSLNSFPYYGSFQL